MISLTNKLNESLLDDEEDLINNNDGLIEQFLKDNYDIDGTYTIKNGIVNVNGDVILNKDSKVSRLTNGLFSFGKVSGTFFCSLTQITSLEGSPREVGNSFICAYCNNLKNLKGSPREVGGSFICKFCSNLTSLTGLPKSIKKDFACECCPKLNSVKPAYEVTNGNVYS